MNKAQTTIESTDFFFRTPGFESSLPIISDTKIPEMLPKIWANNSEKIIENTSMKSTRETI